jgi:hypothetical protein
MLYKNVIYHNQVRLILRIRRQTFKKQSTQFTTARSKEKAGYSITSIIKIKYWFSDLLYNACNLQKSVFWQCSIGTDIQRKSQVGMHPHRMLTHTTVVKTMWRREKMEWGTLCTRESHCILQ